MHPGPRTATCPGPLDAVTSVPSLATNRTAVPATGRPAVRSRRSRGSATLVTEIGPASFEP